MPEGFVFFKRGDVVVIDSGAHRWCVAKVTDGSGATVGGDVDVFQVADLVDENGETRSARTDRLTKVAG